MALASRGSVDSSARVHVRFRLSLTSPGVGADDGGIHGLLRAMPKGQSVRDDFDSAVVGQTKRSAANGARARMVGKQSAHDAQ